MGLVARPLLHCEIGWLIASGKLLENATGTHLDFLLHPPMCFFYTMLSVSVFVSVYARSNSESPEEGGLEEREYASDVSTKFGYLWSGFVTTSVLVLLAQSVLAISFASMCRKLGDPADRKSAFVRYAAVACLVAPAVIFVQTGIGA